MGLESVSLKTLKPTASILNCSATLPRTLTPTSFSVGLGKVFHLVSGQWLKLQRRLVLIMTQFTSVPLVEDHGCTRCSDPTASNDFQQGTDQHPCRSASDTSPSQLIQREEPPKRNYGKICSEEKFLFDLLS